MKIELDSLITIIREVFENDNLQITFETKASDIEEWDSINHIYLIVEIEKRFKIKFTTNKIQSWSCVRDILQNINELI